MEDKTGNRFAPERRDENGCSFLVFTLDGRSYGLPAAGVERVLRAFAPVPVPGAPAAITGLLNLHGRIIPLLNGRRILGLPERELLPSDHFIITAAAGRAFAFPADSVPDLVTCTPENLLCAEEMVPGGDSVDRVIRTAHGLILVCDACRLLRRGELAPMAEEPA